MPKNIFLMIIAMFLSTEAFCQASTPVLSVVNADGKSYSVDYRESSFKTRSRSGVYFDAFLQAEDQANGQPAWEERLYRIEIAGKKNVEIHRIFVKDLSIKDGCVVAVDEKNNVYTVDIGERTQTGFRIQLEREQFNVGDQVKITLFNDLTQNVDLYPLSIDKFVNNKWVEWAFDVVFPCTSCVNHMGETLKPGIATTIIYDQLGHDFESSNTGCTSPKKGTYRVSAMIRYLESERKLREVTYFKEYKVTGEQSPMMVRYQ
ncbi:MAG: hypothetical protein Q8Q08_00055 [Candidatus Omnitrophota bacterium]|nr:hypothetical protein [Candidatus Omnitrophota bacterium]MDZ4342469.1 hypothetical protein [Candidatus Binatia bacterium]